MLAPVVHAIAGRIPFDALLIGRGHRTCEGLVHIDDILHLQGLPASFVAEYDAVARHDSVAQFFLDCPWEPQAVSTADYAPAEPDAASLSPAGRRASADLSRAIVHDYLVRHGIRHFMLAGLESSYGLAWATLYRLTDDPGETRNVYADPANAGIRREPELPEHEEIVAPPPSPEQEFEFLDDEPDVDAAKARAMRQRMRMVARQVAMNPDDGIDL